MLNFRRSVGRVVDDVEHEGEADGGDRGLGSVGLEGDGEGVGCDRDPGAGGADLAAVGQDGLDVCFRMLVAGRGGNGGRGVGIRAYFGLGCGEGGEGRDEEEDWKITQGHVPQCAWRM